MHQERPQSEKDTALGWSTAEVEALENFHEANKAASNKMVWTNIAEIQKRRGDFNEALKAIRNGLRLDPDYVNAHNERGQIHLAAAASHRGAGDIHRRERALRAATASHRRAAQLVADAPDYHRAEVRRRFVDDAEKRGFEVDGEGIGLRVRLPDSV